MPDPRRQVGGHVWAKADAVSKECKRVFGAAVSRTWLQGTVVEVISQRNEGAKRATTMIKACYTVGHMEKLVCIPLQSLKEKDPTATTPEAPDGTNNSPSSSENASEGTGESMPQLDGIFCDDVDSSDDDEDEDNLDEEDESGKQRPASSNHGRNWYEGVVDVDVNGHVPTRYWKMTCQWTGRVFLPGSDKVKKHRSFTPYDYFMACFPREQLKAMVELTSAVLKLKGKKVLTYGELLKWFGINIAMTLVEFGDRSALWEGKHECKFVQPQQFGTTGMSRDRYEDILRYLLWSFQPDERPDGMSSETYRWMLVQDFVDRYNDHRKNHFTPSFLICVDESMSRWYGMGGHWINAGLPCYIAFDRKPEDGCEIQNSACGYSGIMLRLKLVRSAAGEAEMQVDVNEPAHNNFDAEEDERQGVAATTEENGYVPGALLVVAVTVV